MKKLFLLLIVLAAFFFYWKQTKDGIDFGGADIGTQYSVKVDDYKDQLKDGLNKLEKEVFSG